jgi:hypothetical protein
MHTDAHHRRPRQPAAFGASDSYVRLGPGRCPRARRSEQARCKRSRRSRPAPRSRLTDRARIAGFFHLEQ